MSHPSWVRGLKLSRCKEIDTKGLSHPSWVRGLKPCCTAIIVRMVSSHPSWVRGLKPACRDAVGQNGLSHPSWVRGLKLSISVVVTWYYESHPSWVRGLKPFHDVSRINAEKSHPLVGAWIETHIHLSSLYDNMILPLLYICFLKGTIVLFAGHICTISRHFYSISFYKNGLRKYPSPCYHFQISADV